MSPSKAEEVRAYTIMLHNRELLTIKKFLLDLECGEDLVASILSGDEDGGSDGNGIDDGDRDNASINDCEDNDDGASY